MSDIVVSFEPPAVGLGVIVSNQYDSVLGAYNGVDFSYILPSLPPSSRIPSSGYGALMTRQSPPGAPGTQVATLWGPGEFGTAAALGRFNSPHQHVGILVGQITQDPMATPTLTAYDINGQPVATDSASISAGGQGVQLNAISPSATPDIFFFVIQGADNGIGLWITNLTYDSVSTADPDFRLNNVGIVVCQGGLVIQSSKLDRFGGSNGDITLLAEPPLPAGVSVTFNPPVVAATAETFSVVASAAASANLVSASFVISGTPGDATAGPQEQFAQGSVTVVAPFELSTQAGYAPTQTIEPCAPSVLSLQVTSNLGFPGGQVSFACTGLPSAIICTIQPSVVQLGSYPSTASASVTFTTTAQPVGNIPINFVAQAAGFSRQVAFTLIGLPTSINSVDKSYASTPQALQPGDTVIIKGQGFCPGTKVRFGNDLAIATPDFLSNSEIRATVPRTATTGVTGPGTETSNWPSQLPFGLILPDGTAIPSSSPLNISEYRNVFGFPFHNYYFGGIDFDQLTELFGQDATYDSIFGWEVRDPWAMVYNAVINAFLKIGIDICLGMCLATQRLRNNEWGTVDIQDLPTSNSGVYLAFTYLNAGPALPPPPPLDDFIHVQHAAQMSDEWMQYYLNASLQLGGSPDTQNYIKACLQNDDFPLVALRQGLSAGHVVVAYDIEPNPNDGWGSFIIDVYDPNNPFAPGTGETEQTLGEDTDPTGDRHRNALQASQITVAADGSWMFPMNANSSDDPPFPLADYWSGGSDSLIVGSSSIIPATPTMPGLFSSLLLAFEGSFLALGAGQASGARTRASAPTRGSIETIQLSDVNGRTLFSTDRVLNKDPKTRVSAAPLVALSAGQEPVEAFVVKQGGAYRHEVRGKAAGRYGIQLVGRFFNVSLVSATAADQRDEIILDTGGRSFSFKTGSTDVPLQAEVMVRGPDQSVRLATLVTRTTAGTSETIRFSSDTAALTYEHHGPPVTYELHISSMNREGRLHSFTSGLQIARDGHAATFTPADWHDLKRVMLLNSGAPTTVMSSAQPEAREHTAETAAEKTLPKKGPEGRRPRHRED